MILSLDLAGKPYVPCDNFQHSVVEHTYPGSGLVKVSSKKIKNCSFRLEDEESGEINYLNLFTLQDEAGRFSHKDMYQMCKDETILNANFLDFLLRHKEDIPENWKGKKIVFWGTVYRRHEPGHDLYVRILSHTVRWGWYWSPINWNNRKPGDLSFPLLYQLG